MVTVQLSQSNHPITLPLFRLLSFTLGSSLIAPHAYHSMPTNDLTYKTHSEFNVINTLVAILHLTFYWWIQSSTNNIKLHQRFHPHITSRIDTNLYIHYINRRCPKRHFRGNQLPGSSFGLSPLYSSYTIELHVRTAKGFH